MEWWVAAALIFVSAALHHGIHVLELHPSKPGRFVRREPSRLRRP